MKEKLIRFTRTKENEKLINTVYLANLFVWLVVFLMCNKTWGSIKIILYILYLLEFVAYVFMGVMFKEKEEVLKTNKLVEVFLANSNSLSDINFMIFIIFMVVLCETILSTCIAVIAFFTIKKMLVPKVSAYFQTKIK